MKIQSLINIEEEKYTKDDILDLLKMEDASELYETADRIRKEYVGDDVHLRGIIEFSNH